MRDFTKQRLSRNLAYRAFKTLPTDEARLLMLYLTACEHQNAPVAFGFLKGTRSMISGSLLINIATASLLLLILVSLDRPRDLRGFVGGWFEANSAMNDRPALGVPRVIGASKATHSAKVPSKS